MSVTKWKLSEVLINIIMSVEMEKNVFLWWLIKWQQYEFCFCYKFINEVLQAMVCLCISKKKKKKKCMYF